MAKIVQIAGDVASVMNGYVGPAREITAVTDSRELRLHDNATPGGHRFLSKAVTDLLYQGKSSELDALSGLDQTRGLIVRAGAASYLTRKIIGAANQIVVTNQDGFSGDFTVSLPDTIDKANLAFVQSVTFQNGISGALTGNVTGNVTGNLTGASAGTHTGAHIGPVDVRGQVLQLDDGQIPIAKLAAAPALLTDPGVLKSGFICMWAGTIATIPAGWLLCDGQNGTPDLRDKFVLGAGNVPSGNQGGALTHNHPGSSAVAGAHSHPVTIDNTTLTLNQIPAHQHGSGYGTTDAGLALWGTQAASGVDRFDQNTNSRSLEALTQTKGGGAAHNHTGSSAAVADHSHAITINNSNHMPPYYALAYIMRQ